MPTTVDSTTDLTALIASQSHFSAKIDPTWGWADISNETLLHTSPTSSLRGFVHAEIDSHNFLNLPYARIPGRFLPSRKIDLATLSGTLDARHYGPRSAQPGSARIAMLDQYFEHVGYSQRMSEFDCLQLNVYTPPSTVTPPQGGFPVLCYCHGGGYTQSDNLARSDGNDVIRRSIELGKPVVVVSLTYRLGMLGFFTSKEILEEQKALGDAPSMNLGLLDQRNALEWVQSHITLFGGNPRRVTLSAQSAGAGSLWFHLKGKVENLFERCIIMSLGPPEPVLFADKQALFDKIVASLNISKDAPAAVKVAALKGLTVQELLSYMEGTPMGPVADPTGLVEPKVAGDYDSLDYWTDSPSWVKDVMIGCTRDEAAMFVAFATPDLNWDDARSAIRQSKLPPHVAEQIIASPSFKDADSPARAYSNVVSYGAFVGKMFDAGKLMAKKGKTPVRFYEVDIGSPFPGRFFGYAHHSICLPLLFCAPKTLRDAELGETMKRTSAMWIDYVYGGEGWPAIVPGKEEYMSLNGTKTGMKSMDTPDSGVFTLATQEDRELFYKVGFSMIHDLFKVTVRQLKSGLESANK